METLLPCPFCGGKAEIQENEDWPDCVKQPKYYYTVGCQTDGCVCELDYDCQPYDTEKDAQKAWNTRRYTQVIHGYTTRELEKFYQDQQDLDPEISAIVDKHFWELA